MRFESSVTAISWIPSEAVEGLPKIPFSIGVAHYDEPPPDVIVDLEAMTEADAFREANELHAFIEVEDGKIVDYGHLGGGHLGVTKVKLGPREVSVPAIAMPTLQPEPEVGDGWVRFTQTAGGRTGMPAPRHVHGKPFFQISSALAWTTLSLTLYADGSSEHKLKGASTFPRHWVYREGKLVEKSGLIDFKEWYRKAFGENTPWGQDDSEPFVTAVETALERDLSPEIMRSGTSSKPRTLDVDDDARRTGRAPATSSTCSSTECWRQRSTARRSPRSAPAQFWVSGRCSKVVRARRRFARSRLRRSCPSRPASWIPRRSRRSR